MKIFAAFAVSLSFLTVAAAHATPPASANRGQVLATSDHAEGSTLSYSYTMMTYDEWLWLCNNVGYPYC